MLVLRRIAVGDACFYQLLLMMMASGFDAGSAEFSAGDACFCQLLPMMLALGFDDGSAEVFGW